MTAYGYERSELGDEISQLRKAGNLQEAYELARSCVEHGICDEGVMGSYAWVLYDCLKRYYDEGTKFYKQEKPFRITLAQIRKFPDDDAFGDVFIQQVTARVRGVAWELAKANQSDLYDLACEVCLWPRTSFLYTGDIARALIIGLKTHGPGCATVLGWLGLPDTAWEDVVAGAVDPQRLESLDGTAKEALLWAVYDDLKAVAGDDALNGLDLDAFLRLFGLMKQLDPRTSKAREALTYALGKFKHIGWESKNKGDLRMLNALLDEAVASSGYSFMRQSDVLKMFLAAFKEQPRQIIKLAEWYGFAGFTSADYEERVEDGKTYPSLAQRCVKAYLDALTACDDQGNPMASPSQKNDGADTVAAVLNGERAKGWIWESYALANLLSDVRRYKEARSRLAPIVMSKSKESWAWAALGRAWAEESQEAFEACVFKGLTVASDVQHSLRLHEDAMEIFASHGLFACAKAEAGLIDACRASNGWPRSKRVAALADQKWFFADYPEPDMAKKYEELSANAEDVLAEEFPLTELYAEWKDEGKGIAGIALCTGETKWGTLEVLRMKIYDSQAAQVEAGACYTCHVMPGKKKLIGRIEPCPDAKIASYFIGTFSGTLDLVKDFAFVRAADRSIWVSPALLKGKGAKQYQSVTVSCRKVFREKSGWTWEATSLGLGEEVSREEYEKTFSGWLDVTRKGFGFVDDCFIPESLIREAGYRSGDHVEVRARKQWDTKKRRWGWTAVEALGGRNE